jgi:hypothetical protein
MHGRWCTKVCFGKDGHVDIGLIAKVKIVDVEINVFSHRRGCSEGHFHDAIYEYWFQDHLTMIHIIVIDT